VESILVILFSFCIIFWCCSYITILLKRGLEFSQEQHSRSSIFLRFDKLMDILNQSKDIAYKKIYQEELIVHTSSGYKLSNEEIQIQGASYVKLVLTLCGPSVEKDLVSLFGNIDSICLFLIHGFITKINDNEAELLRIITNDETTPEETHKVFLEKQLRGE